MLDYEYLIHLIYCAVHDEQPLEKPEEVSFYNVLHLGKIHEVANIAYLSVERLEKKPPQEIYDEWKGFYYLSAPLVKSEMQKQILASIIGITARKENRRHSKRCY